MEWLEGIRQRLSQNQFARRLALAAGFGRGANRMSEQAVRRGEKLKFGVRKISWNKGDETIHFPSSFGLALISYYLYRMPTFRPRVIFQSIRGRKVADLSGIARYRLPSGNSLWLPVPAEPIDFFTGYFAKGGPRKGHVVLDAGAYCGETTLEMAARVGPSGHVYAFEPDPKNLAWLRRNVEESGFSNITVVPKGLWGQTDTLKFYADETPGSTLVASDGADAVHRKPMEIDVLSPADAFKLIGRIPDFIKMDIEGAEVEVVEAMAPLLRGADVSLAIASYHLRDGRKTCEIITSKLAGAGLNVETGHEDHLTTWAWKR
ncbi:MAG: FkbM family methyltransferase [Nibricoccus sp.]